MDEKLLDENGKPKNALYASIAAKKDISVSNQRVNLLSITMRTRLKTSQLRELSISKVTERFTEVTQF